jgi:hypothetical protein
VGGRLSAFKARSVSAVGASVATVKLAVAATSERKAQRRAAKRSGLDHQLPPSRQELMASEVGQRRFAGYLIRRQAGSMINTSGMSALSLHFRH